MIISFCFFLLAFVAIGLLSYRKSQGTKKDYYLASNSISPELVGLSAVATNNSGYMFIGVIGYTYSAGLSAMWLMVGWIVGDFIASRTIHSRLIAAKNKSGALSYGELLSRWQGEPQPLLQKLIAIISLIFLLTYASAQLLAGSKALHVLLDWPTWAGAVGGAIMVALYCVAGGIRASIWTDAAQSVVMITAMAILLGVGIYSLGGFGDTFTQLNAIPNYMNLTVNADAPISGLILFLMGWMVAGFSVAGQPHIMVRFMTLNNNQSIGRAKIWYYAWFVAFYCMATGVGFLARIYLADTTTFDAELALPTIAQHLLPPALTGLILAGIFAATMSTADSLLLSCSSALSHDLFPKHITQTWLLRVCTFVLTLIALGIALTAHSNVFNLVIMAWSGLGSAFIPLLIILCAGAKPSQFISITMLLVGLSVAVVWRYAGLNSILYEGLPGITAGLGVWVVAWGISKTTRRTTTA